MATKSVLKIVIIVIGGAFLCWGTWVTNAPLQNKAAIIENKIAIRENNSQCVTKFEGLEAQLKIHYGLLKEIRDEQRRRK